MPGEVSPIENQIATAPTPNGAKIKFASRKFLLVLLMWGSSFFVCLYNPEFVGTLQNATNFWLLLCGVYAGANVGELIAARGKKQ
jgi:hypothetical protein